LPQGVQQAEALLFHFDQAWRSDTPPRIDDYLTRLASSAGQEAERRRILEDLVKIDLEYRWRRTPSGSKPWTLEEYVKQHPQLGPVQDLSLDLIAGEYLVRNLWGDRPRQAEYFQRFPRHGARLLTELAKVDAEVAGELNRKANPVSTGLTPPSVSRAPVQTQVTLAELLAFLSRADLLTAQQKEELSRSLAGRFSDVRALAAELLRRGWLTAYQVNQLLQGHGQDLLLEPYVLLERLGEGGAGQVFKARHQRLNRIVALKLIRKELLAEPEVIGRFLREVQILSQLDHPNIVHAYDAGPITPVANAPGSSKGHYLAMEFIEGSDLGRLVKQGGPMPVQQACEYIRQAACGLAHAHERGLVHRDIKPHNLVMGVRDGLIKVADLGLARLPRAMTGEVTAALSGAKGTGTLTPENAVLMGTADYLAPEQALDFHRADIRADIYSLGCTFYYLLAGQPPYPEGNLAQKVARHMNAEVPAVEQARPDLPAGLPAIVHKMLAKKPEDRYQTPAELATALSPYAQSGNQSATFRHRAALTATKLVGLRHILGSKTRATLAVTAVVVLALVAILAWRSWTPPSGPKKIDQFVLKKHDYGHMVAFSPGGQLAASAGGEGDIILWEMPTGKELGVLKGHKEGITHLAFSPAGRLLVSGASQGKVWKLWDINAQKELASHTTEASTHPSNPFVGPFSPDGKYLAVRQSGDSVLLADVARVIAGSFDPAHKTPFAKVEAFALAFTPDSRTLAVATYNRIFFYDIPSGSKQEVSASITAQPGAMAFTPDGKTLAVALHNQEVHLFDKATLKVIRTTWKVRTPQTLPSRTPPLLLAISPDGETVACSGWDHQVKLWDPATGKERATIAALETYRLPVSGLGFTPDNKTLYIAGEDDTLRVWRVR
jgi:serine/threonine protein kinase